MLMYWNFVACYLLWLVYSTAELGGHNYPWMETILLQTPKRNLHVCIHQLRWENTLANDILSNCHIIHSAHVWLSNQLWNTQNVEFITSPLVGLHIFKQGICPPLKDPSGLRTSNGAHSFREKVLNQSCMNSFTSQGLHKNNCKEPTREFISEQ